MLKHRFMKTCGGVEVKLCVSLISALDGGGISAYVVPSLYLRKQPVVPTDVRLDDGFATRPKYTCSKYILSKIAQYSFL